MDYRQSRADIAWGLKKVKEETRRLEEEMDSGDFTPDPGQIIANRPVSFRAYKVEADYFNRPRTVREIERYMKSRELRHFVERLRINGEIMDPDPDIRVHKGDIIVLSGRRESIVQDASWIGTEVSDHELLTFGSENLPVVVSKKGAAGVTLGELRNQPFMHGVMVHKILRNDMPLPLRKRLMLEKGEVVTLVGLLEDVEAAVPEIGFSDRQTHESDIVFIGLAIAIGCIIGAIVIRCGNIPVSLNTSGGAILSGLVLGWLRSKRPSFGHILRSVIWFMDNAGLYLFIAVVGLSAGPSLYKRT